VPLFVLSVGLGGHKGTQHGAAWEPDDSDAQRSASVRRTGIGGGAPKMIGPTRSAR